MSENVLQKRCGCGALHGLRESCSRCADRQRSVLHASGVATMRGQEHCGHPEEHWRRDTDRCGLCGVAGYAAIRAGKHPHAKSWADLKLPERGFGNGRRSDGSVVLDEVAEYKPLPSEAERRVREHFCEHEPPAIGEHVSYERAKADMQARPEARYEHSAANGVGVYGIVGTQLTSYRNAPCYASFSGGYENTGTWRRVW